MKKTADYVPEFASCMLGIRAKIALSADIPAEVLEEVFAKVLVAEMLAAEVLAEAVTDCSIAVRKLMSGLPVVPPTKNDSAIECYSVVARIVIGTAIGISLHRFRLSSRGQHTSPTICI